MELLLTKKKVLITMDWFDPAYKAGGPVMSIIKLVENLHEYYDFYILTGSVDYGDTEELKGITQNEWIDWRGIAKVYYLSESDKSRRRIFFILDEIEADIYYVQGVFSLYFSVFPLIWWHQIKADKIIVATRGMFHQSALRVKRLKKMLFLYAAKIMGWYHHVVFHSTNADETEQMKKILGNEATYVEALNFPRIMPFCENKKKNSGALKLLNVARISPEKDTLFLLEFMQKVSGNIELTLVGNYADESYYQDCLKAAEAAGEGVKIHFAGHQPIEKLEKYYHENDVFILPTRGENFGHSIIEALSSGLPCIISTGTPWMQLEASNAGINLERDKVSYAQAIMKYLHMDQTEYTAASRAARNYSGSNIQIESIKQAYFNLLK